MFLRVLPAVVLTLSMFIPAGAMAQIDEDQLGGWYMLAYNIRFDDSRWGLQGDFQHRNFDLSNDLEQLLLRSGVTYRPTWSSGLFTLGYANISSGTFGPNSDKTWEDRVYQEALFSQTVNDQLKLGHRFRFEQRWVDDQDFRTRLRYMLSATVPLNLSGQRAGATYLSFYNELFINTTRDIGDGRRVDFFDRNRSYAALGYRFSDVMQLQFGYMYQISDNVEKGQTVLSLHGTF